MEISGAPKKTDSATSAERSNRARPDLSWMYFSVAHNSAGRNATARACEGMLQS